MSKAGLMGFMLSLMCGGLVGCQMMSSSHQSQRHLSASSVEVLKSPTPQGLVSLHCSGGIDCEFAQLNKIIVIDEVSKQPTPEALRASVVRYENDGWLSGSQENAQFFVAMQPGVNEVKVRFYPVTRDRAENFSLIHSFRAGKNYRLTMYRERAASSSDSLLSMATPGPLCIQLFEDEQVIRRFCRPFDPSTGLGEFVEQRVTD